MSGGTVSGGSLAMVGGNLTVDGYGSTFKADTYLPGWATGPMHRRARELSRQLHQHGGDHQ